MPTSSDFSNTTNSADHISIVVTSPSGDDATTSDKPRMVIPDNSACHARLQRICKLWGFLNYLAASGALSFFNYQETINRLIEKDIEVPNATIYLALSLRMFTLLLSRQKAALGRPSNTLLEYRISRASADGHECRVLVPSTWQAYVHLNPNVTVMTEKSLAELLSTPQEKELKFILPKSSELTELSKKQRSLYSDDVIRIAIDQLIKPTQGAQSFSYDSIPLGIPSEARQAQEWLQNNWHVLVEGVRSGQLIVDDAPLSRLENLGRYFANILACGDCFSVFVNHFISIVALLVKIMPDFTPKMYQELRYQHLGVALLAFIPAYQMASIYYHYKLGAAKKQYMKWGHDITMAWQNDCEKWQGNTTTCIIKAVLWCLLRSGALVFKLPVLKQLRQYLATCLVHLQQWSNQSATGITKDLVFFAPGLLKALLLDPLTDVSTWIIGAILARAISTFMVTNFSGFHAIKKAVNSCQVLEQSYAISWYPWIGALTSGCNGLASGLASTTELMCYLKMRLIELWQSLCARQYQIIPDSQAIAVHHDSNQQDWPIAMVMLLGYLLSFCDLSLQQGVAWIGATEFITALSQWPTLIESLDFSDYHVMITSACIAILGLIARLAFNAPKVANSLVKLFDNMADKLLSLFVMLGCYQMFCGSPQKERVDSQTSQLNESVSLLSPGVLFPDESPYSSTSSVFASQARPTDSQTSQSNQSASLKRSQGSLSSCANRPRYGSTLSVFSSQARPTGKQMSQPDKDALSLPSKSSWQRCVSEPSLFSGFERSEHANSVNSLPGLAPSPCGA